MDKSDARVVWLERTVETYETQLLRFCCALLGDAYLAEDAVQETFLRAWRGLHDFRGQAAEKTWLMRIAINVCRDTLRLSYFRRTDRRVTPEQLPEPPAPLEEWDDTVSAAILRLPLKYRRAVLLHYYEDLTVLETARVLNVSESTVHRLLRKAEDWLKHELEDWYHA